jgi:hypothetical protein
MERRRWLQGLALRVADIPGDANVANARLMEYVRGLSDIHQDAFCEESMEAGARQFEFFPPYATVRKFLEIWLADFRTRRHPVLPGADQAGLNAQEMAVIQSWQSNWAGDYGTHKNGVARTRGASPEYGLKLLQKMHLRAFRWLVLNDANAAGVAARAGLDDTHWTEHTEEEKEHVAQAVRKTVAELKAKTLYQEPDVGHLADAVAQAAAAADAHFESIHGRKPGSLSAERLEAIRAADPGVQKARAWQAQQRRP